LETLTLPANAQQPSISLDFLEDPSRVARVDFLGEFPDSRAVARVAHLSPSHLRDRSFCGAQNWYQRTRGLRRPAGATMLRGTAIHSGLNVALHRNRTTLERGRVHPVSLEEFTYLAQRTAYRAARREIARARSEAGIVWDRRWQKGPFLDEQSLLYDVYRAIKAIAPAYYLRYPLAVEAAFLLYWKSNNVLPLMAIADLIELCDDDTLGIRDTKTSIRKKSQKELALDRGLIAYGACSSDYFGMPVTWIAYDNVTFTGPGKKKDSLPKPTITHHEFRLPFEAHTVDALEIESADAMLDLNDTRISPRRSTMTCPGCPFKNECGRDFGPLHTFLTQTHTEDDESDG
jgi:hypothetical protein